MNDVALLQAGSLGMVLLVAVFFDLRERRIPNKVTASGLLLGLLLGAFLEGGFPGTALWGALLALLVAFPLFALGGLGAGDVKLFAVVGSFVGAGQLLAVIMYGLLAGGILAFVNIIRRGAFWATFWNMKELCIHIATFGHRGRRAGLDQAGAHSVPYGLAIAAGAVLAWFFPLSLG
jgi:prepilin peptidase CpaA